MNSMHSEPPDDFERRLAQLAIVEPSADYGNLANSLRETPRQSKRLNWRLAAGFIAVSAAAIVLTLPWNPLPRENSAQPPIAVTASQGDTALVAEVSTQAPAYIAGIHYKEVNRPVSIGVQSLGDIRLFFSYPCYPCYEFEAVLDAWTANSETELSLNYVPVTWSQSLRYYAQLFYTAEALGVQDQAHEQLFSALHLENQALGEQENIVSLFESLGISQQRFLTAYNSVEVSDRVEEAVQANEAFDIQSTPTLVIDCRYRISPNNEIGQQDMVSVAEFLIENRQGQERQLC